jgi:hypothetical protein
MSQKINPISFRNRHFFENSSYSFLQQSYSSLLSSYAFCEQRLVLSVVQNFFNFLSFNLHSLRCVKMNTQGGVVCLIVKYVLVKKHNNKKVSFLFYFSCPEHAIIYAISKIITGMRLQISFFNLAKKKGLVSSIFFNTARLFRQSELIFNLKALLFFKGGALFLGFIFYKKLQKMKSRIERKKQSFLVLFANNLFRYVLNHNTVSIKGMRFRLKGRLNGSLRKKYSVFSKGKISLHQIDARMDYFYCPIQTVYGSFGLKFWINYGKN